MGYSWRQSWSFWELQRQLNQKSFLSRRALLNDRALMARLTAKCRRRRGCGILMMLVAAAARIFGGWLRELRVR